MFRASLGGDSSPGTPYTKLVFITCGDEQVNGGMEW
jgi:hypothetical protein